MSNVLIHANVYKMQKAKDNYRFRSATWNQARNWRKNC